MTQRSQLLADGVDHAVQRRRGLQLHYSAVLVAY